VIRTRTVASGVAAVLLAAVATLLACRGAPPAQPWTAFTLREGWGPCEPGKVCADSWTVLAGGPTVRFAKAGVESTATLSEPDRAALAGLLAGAEFQAAMASPEGFACPPAPTDVFDRFSLTLADGSERMQLVTGCLDHGSGAPAGAPGAIQEILRRYGR
jgi:hypothetical protein